MKHEEFMGWQTIGKSKYYYRKYRIGNNVHSQYIGTGPIAEDIAIKDEIQREKFLQNRKAVSNQLEKEKQFIDLIREINKQNLIIVKALLLIDGYHTHKGQWRKNRD